MLISIVGKSGSGKSTISKILKSYSDKIVILEVDKFQHQTLKIKNIKDAIYKNIGNVFDEHYNIDRMKLRKIVFNDKEKLDYLNSLSWNYLEIMIDEFIDINKDKIIIIDWLLTPLTKYFALSNIKILVDAPFKLRLTRIMKRDNITLEDFIKRDKHSPVLIKEKFDIVINNTEVNNLEKEVEKIYDKSIIHR